MGWDSSPEPAFRDRAEAFARGDVDAAASFYDVVCLYIMPEGVTLFPDSEFTRAAMSQGMEAMRAQGYHRTEFKNLQSRRLSSNLVGLSGTFVRLRSDGEELNRSGFTYTLRRNHERWKLVCAILHDESVE